MSHGFLFILTLFEVFYCKGFYDFFKAIEVEEAVVLCVFFEDLGQEVLLESLSIFPRMPHYIIFSTEYHKVGNGEHIELFFIFLQSLMTS